MDLKGLRRELEEISGIGVITINKIINHLQVKGFNNIAVGGNKWITDHLPEHDVNVIAQCEVRRTDGSRSYYQCMACYLHDKQEEVGSDWRNAVYSEEEDCYYAPTGWYEVTINSDEYTYHVIDDFIVAWQPLPDRYVSPLN